MLGQYRNSDGEIWYYLRDFRNDLPGYTGWAIQGSAFQLADTPACTNLALVGQQGQPVPPPPTDNLLDNCLFMMPIDGVEVLTMEQITTNTNGGTESPIDTLAIDTPVFVKSLHPNRQYLEIDYNDMDGVSHTNWIKRRTGLELNTGEIVINESADCLLNLTPDPNRLPECQPGQVVNCRPQPACSWIFGCGNNTLHHRDFRRHY